MGITQGTIKILTDLEQSLSELNFMKGVKVAGPILLGSSTFANVMDVIYAYQNNDPSYHDKAVNATIDLAVGLLALSTGGIGFALRTTYYILDESGYIQEWTHSAENWLDNFKLSARADGSENGLPFSLVKLTGLKVIILLI